MRKTDVLKTSIFLSLRSFFLGQFLENSSSRTYHWILKLLVATLKSEFWEQNCVWVFYHFNFKRYYSVLKSKSLCILSNKNINLIKRKRNWKWKITHIVLKRRTLCFTWYKNRKSKIKQWWAGPRQIKKRVFLYRLFWLKEIFLTIVFYLNVLNTISEYTYCYISKNITSDTFLLVFKIAESPQYILKYFSAFCTLSEDFPERWQSLKFFLLLLIILWFGWIEC